MKKKFLIGAFLGISFLGFAQDITVTTTCGTVSTIHMSDNATLSQIAAAVSQVNVNQCGVKPAKVIVSVEP